MKHYTVILDWATDAEQGVEVLGVTHTPEDAQKIFNKQLAEERKIAEENGWETVVDDADCFEAYVKGYYDNGHSSLFIKENDFYEDLLMEQQEQM